MKHNAFPIIFGFALFLVLSLCGAGYFDTIDAEASFETARALYNDRSFYSDPLRPDGMLYAQRADGQSVSKLGLALPVFYLAPVALGAWVAQLLHLPERETQEFLITFVNPLFTALLIFLIYTYARSWSRRRAALGLSLILGFATLLFPYSKTAHREPLLALTLFACALAFHPSPARRSRTSLFWAGSAAGIAFLCKNAIVVPLAPLVLYGLSTKKREFVFFLFPFSVALFIQGAFSYFTWGTVWGTGYSEAVTTFHSSVWSTPFWNGLYLQLFSPRSGLVFYCPLIIGIGLIAAHKIKTKSFSHFDASVVAAFCLQAMLYAKWWAPTGGEALGPRHLLPVLPLLFLLLDKENLPWLWRRFRVSTVLLVVLSFSFQILHVSVKPQQFWTLEQYARQPLPYPPWATNLVFFMQKWKRAPEIYAGNVGLPPMRPVDLSPFETLQGFNYWWMHLMRARSLEKTSLPNDSEKSAPEPESVS